jgi:hypothetical protein
LRDLSFAHIGNENFLKHEEGSNNAITMVNFEKMAIMYDIAIQIEQFQIVPYKFKVNYPVFNFLMGATTLSDETLDHHSLMCEKRLNEI